MKRTECGKRNKIKPMKCSNFECYGVMDSSLQHSFWMIDHHPLYNSSSNSFAKSVFNENSFHTVCCGNSNSSQVARETGIIYCGSEIEHDFMLFHFNLQIEICDWLPVLFESKENNSQSLSMKTEIPINGKRNRKNQSLRNTKPDPIVFVVAFITWILFKMIFFVCLSANGHISYSWFETSQNYSMRCTDCVLNYCDVVYLRFEL